MILIFEYVFYGSVRRGYSSGVEHSTADREVPGSIPGVPYFWLFSLTVLRSTQHLEAPIVRFNS